MQLHQGIKVITSLHLHHCIVDALKKIFFDLRARMNAPELGQSNEHFMQSRFPAKRHSNNNEDRHHE